jgi:hypothetical protein
MLEWIEYLMWPVEESVVRFNGLMNTRPHYVILNVLITVCMNYALLKYMESRRRKVTYWLKKLNVFAVIVYTAIATQVTYTLMKQPDRDFMAVVGVIVGIVGFWSLFCHVVAYAMGPRLTSWCGPSWVKCIDYIYLAGSTYGILRIAMQNNVPQNAAAVTPVPAADMDAIGVVILGIALSIRLTKTTIEIRGWDKREVKDLAELSPPVVALN